jgi:hypothetical protein
MMIEKLDHLLLFSLLPSPIKRVRRKERKEK